MIQWEEIAFVEIATGRFMQIRKIDGADWLCDVTNADRIGAVPIRPVCNVELVEIEKRVVAARARVR